MRSSNFSLFIIIFLALILAACSGSGSKNNDGDSLNDGEVNGDGEKVDGDQLGEVACIEDQVRLMACGDNKEKVQSQVCKSGKWINKGDCVEDAQKCVDGEARFMECEGGKVQKQVCLNGTWGELGPCGGQTQGNECAAAETRSIVCGLNNMLEQKQKCVDGKWANDGECLDPGICENGDEKLISCGTDNGAVQKKVCVDGKWETVGKCAVPDDPAKDTDKKLIRKIFKNAFGQITAIEEFIYDKDGVLYGDIIYDPDGAISALTEKDKFGNVTKDIHRSTSAYGTFTTWKEYAYDTAGRFITVEISKDSSGIISSWKIYERFDKGNVKKETQKNNDGNIISVKEYINIEPAYSILMTETHYDDFGNMSSRMERQLINGIPRIVSDVTMNGHDYQYTYNTEGLLTKEVRKEYFTSGNEKTVTEYTYDWAGYRKTGTALKKETHYIEKNDSGDIIKERQYNDKFKPTLDFCKGASSYDCSISTYFFVDSGSCSCLTNYSSSCSFAYTNTYHKQWTYDTSGAETMYKYEISVRDIANNTEKTVTVDENSYNTSGKLNYQITGNQCYSSTYKTIYDYFGSSDGLKNGYLKKKNYIRCPGSAYTKTCDLDSAPYDYVLYDYNIAAGNVVNSRTEQSKSLKDAENAMPAIGTTISCSYYASPVNVQARYSYQYGVTSGTTPNTTHETVETMTKTVSVAGSGTCTVGGHTVSYTPNNERWYKMDTLNNYTYLKQNSLEQWWTYTNGNNTQLLEKNTGSADYSKYYNYEYDAYNRLTKYTKYITAGFGTTPTKQDTEEEYGYVDVMGNNLTYGDQYKTRESRYTYDSGTAEHTKTSEIRRELSLSDPSYFVNNFIIYLALKETYNLCNIAGSCGTYGTKYADYRLTESKYASGTVTDTTTVQLEDSSSKVEARRTEYKAYPLAADKYSFYLVFKTKDVYNYEKAKTLYKKNPSTGIFDQKYEYSNFSESWAYNFTDFAGYLNNLHETGYSLTGTYFDTTTKTETIAERIYTATFNELSQQNQIAFCYSSGYTTCSSGNGLEFKNILIAYNEYGQATEYTEKDSAAKMKNYYTATWKNVTKSPWGAYLTAFIRYQNSKDEAGKVYEFTATDDGFPTKIWDKVNADWTEYTYDPSSEYDFIYGGFYEFNTFKALDSHDKIDLYAAPATMAGKQVGMMILPAKTETLKKVDGTASALHNYAYAADAAKRPAKQTKTNHTGELMWQDEFEWGK